MNTDCADSVSDFEDAVDMAVNFKRGSLTYREAAAELRRMADSWEMEED